MKSDTFVVDTSELEKDYPVEIKFSSPIGKYSISTIEPVETIEEMREILLEPLLLSMGYSPKLVGALFGKEIETVPKVFEYTTEWIDWNPVDVDIDIQKELYKQATTAESGSVYKTGDCFYALEESEDKEVEKGEIFVIAAAPGVMMDIKLTAVSLRDGFHYDNPSEVEDPDNITEEEMEDIMPLDMFIRLTKD